MSARGALIMSFFGALFAALTAYWHGLAHGAVLAAPFLVFGLIGLVALKVIRLPGEGLRLSDRVGRVVLWSTIGEGIGLFLAANVVVNLHRPDLLLPSMALVVGLHFVPIAVAAQFRPYLIVGMALVAAAVAGFLVQMPLGGELAGFASAASLWAASVIAVRRDWRAKVGRSASTPREPTQ